MPGIIGAEPVAGFALCVEHGRSDGIGASAGGLQGGDFSGKEIAFEGQSVEVVEEGVQITGG